MATLLSTLAKPKLGAIHCTLVGEGGIGKTSLAATFPKPVFIRTEDGLASLVGKDVQAFPLATKVDQVFEAIGALATEEHDFKTLVIDSITQLNIMIEKEVVASDPKQPKSINQANGGYGAGHNSVALVHQRLREWCNRLASEKGMNVVYIAHADSETIELPDHDPYTRYTVRMNKRSVSHYSDNVDIVAFLKLQTFTSGSGDTKKARTTGERILTCYPTPSHISKNRFGISEDLILNNGENPFAPYINSLLQQGE